MYVKRQYLPEKQHGSQPRRHSRQCVRYQLNRAWWETDPECAAPSTKPRRGAAVAGHTGVLNLHRQVARISPHPDGTQIQ